MRLVLQLFYVELLVNGCVLSGAFCSQDGSQLGWLLIIGFGGLGAYTVCMDSSIYRNSTPR
jgi:hypothetical protein